MGNDMLGTIERGNICRLVEFINDSAPLLKDNPLALGAGDKFQELLEIVSNCPRRGIYFKPYGDIGGIVKPIDDYYGVDEIIPYLFDKVEMNRWYIVKLEYCPKALRSAGAGSESRLDLVRLRLSKNPRLGDLPCLDQYNCMCMRTSMEHPITDETMLKFDSKPTLLEKLRVLLEEAKTPEVLYDKVEQKTETVDGIALVQCFYGNDISRISATTQALEFNLQMTRRPRTWVLVEAQKSKSDCVFNWVKKYGIKHIFVKINSDSDGILLKNPLWNKGADYCVEDRLCFLDSDVVMCNSDWVEKCRDAFDSGLDVMSLASHQYCQADDSCSLHESIGYMWAVKRTVENSHCGFTIGMTRKAWKEIGKFKPALILDDLRTFHTLMGQSTFAPFKKWTSSFKLDNPHALGYNLSLGYADNIACHVWHGDPGSKYEAITRLLNAAGVDDVDSLIEDGENGIPVWKSGLASVDAIRKLLQNSIEDNKDISGSYYKEMRNRLGTPDEKHPLFVCTIVKDCFGLEFKDFVSFKMGVEGAYNPGHGTTPTVVFLTDNNRFKESFRESSLNVLPIDKKILSGKSRNHSIVEMCASALRIVEKGKWRGSTVMYVPFDFKDFGKLELDVWVPDEVVKMGNGVDMGVVK